MKRTVTAIVLSLLLAPGLYAGDWTGWITDSGCGVKGANAEHKGCAMKCAAKGQALVFYNDADKKLYKLDKQDLAKEHLGHAVKVSGEVAGDGIKVSSIAEAKPAAK
ncbi:MAG TPA: DUF5818 domain-containing protein [Thermoanaerobaculia bacterium]|jgi:tRNA isopentenyl-2-thiomethyl-A-37 hydroxylase MiaE|nr:DUF5818 domain-containing protein [Thermoanaerobaculia bacterium]